MSFAHDLAGIRELDRLYLLAVRENTPKAWKRYDDAVADAPGVCPPVTDEAIRKAADAMERSFSKEKSAR